MQDLKHVRIYYVRAKKDGAFLKVDSKELEGISLSARSLFSFSERNQARWQASSSTIVGNPGSIQLHLSAQCLDVDVSLPVAGRQPEIETWFSKPNMTVRVILRIVRC